jgi:hypothetical protein
VPATSPYDDEEEEEEDDAGGTRYGSLESVDEELIAATLLHQQDIAATTAGMSVLQAMDTVIASSSMVMDVDPCIAGDESLGGDTVAPAPSAVNSDPTAVQLVDDISSSSVTGAVSGAQVAQQQLRADVSHAPDARESANEDAIGLCITTNECSPAVSCSDVVVDDLLQGVGWSAASSSCSSASSSPLSTGETTMLLQLLTTLTAEIGGMDEEPSSDPM